ncbi:hypothetical protein [Virgibacillus sp. Bac330]|uniref:hypothetical protein n=1 Tax=Virgibacillus sp. Bac330 TaxID=2419841 RepID=UPI000EF4645E|nr:hypothetical protein [Virgibacillus sp. Bac330]
MLLKFINDYGPEYVGEYKERGESYFTEPFYFELDDNKCNISEIMDKDNQYKIINNNVYEQKNNMDIGKPRLQGKPIILNDNGDALRYGTDVIKVEWENGIKIYRKNQVHDYNFNPQTEPSNLQFIEENLLLTLPKKQIVLIISPLGEILWSFGTKNRPGSGYYLNVPMFALFDESTGTIFISDTLNSRVIQVNEKEEIVWSYGKEGDLGSYLERLWYPICVKPLLNENYAIADSKNDRIIVVSKNKEILKQYGEPIVERFSLTYPRSVQKVSNKKILVANTHKNEIRVFDTSNRDLDIIINTSHLDLHWPRCIKYIKEFSELVIADGLNNRILVIDDKSLEIKKVFTSTIDYNIKDPHDIDFNIINKNFLITSTGSNEVIEINRQGNLINKWDKLNDPHNARYYDNKIVISDSGNSRILIIEKDSNPKVLSILSYLNEEKLILNRPRFVLPYKTNGFLIADTGNHRILVVNQIKNKWYGNSVAIRYSNMRTIEDLSYPRWIEKDKNHLFITDTENCRIIKCEILE